MLKIDKVSPDIVKFGARLVFPEAPLSDLMGLASVTLTMGKEVNGVVKYREVHGCVDPMVVERLLARYEEAKGMYYDKVKQLAKAELTKIIDASMRALSMGNAVISSHVEVVPRQFKNIRIGGVLRKQLTVPAKPVQLSNKDLRERLFAAQELFFAIQFGWVDFFKIYRSGDAILRQVANEAGLREVFNNLASDKAVVLDSYIDPASKQKRNIYSLRLYFPSFTQFVQGKQWTPCYGLRMPTMFSYVYGDHEGTVKEIHLTSTIMPLPANPCRMKNGVKISGDSEIEKPFSEKQKAAMMADHKAKMAAIQAAKEAKELAEAKWVISERKFKKRFSVRDRRVKASEIAADIKAAAKK